MVTRSFAVHYHARQEQAPRIRHVTLLLHGESNAAKIIDKQMVPYSQKLHCMVHNFHCVLIVQIVQTRLWTQREALASQ